MSTEIAPLRVSEPTQAPETDWQLQEPARQCPADALSLYPNRFFNWIGKWN